MIAPELCPHGCACWCATCDFEASHPEGIPSVRAELPGRGAVMCPRNGCGHPLAAHKDGICTSGSCACGLPEPLNSADAWEFPDRASLADRVRGIARAIEDEQPTVALMLERAVRVTDWRTR